MRLSVSAFFATLLHLCVAILVPITLGRCTAPRTPDTAAVCADAALPADLPPPDTLHTRILIDKSDRSLKLFQHDRLLRCYPVVLGFDPVHDKRMEGDGCTPEGKFGVRSKYPHAKWSKFIWIDYPNAASWQKFNANVAGGKLPAGATIGGEVGIHGVPEGMDALVTEHKDWTLGCISLTRKHVDELYEYVGMTTRIEIVP